ncbi:MAG: efflux RND transporter permease subunit, partial [Proteobacteria bacterium]|nr:efflux RND transporter permease subunit [Pseudomonadota bacterium]
LHAIAEDQGMYEEHGVEVEAVQVSDSPTLVQAVASGSAEAGVSLGDSVIRAVDEGAPIVMSGAILERTILRLVGAPGVSSGQAIERVEAVLAETLPEGFSYDWSGASYQEKASSGAGAITLILAAIMVFLILAAQYERWSMPLSVLLALPFGTFGALIAVWVRGMTNDIYFQIGLVTLLGLAAKNAILIVEFAMMKKQEGMGTTEAALEAARLRFRPILMTSLAFILGVTPLAFSSGAGAAARQSVGTGVMGGMLAATFLAIFFVPLFFRLIIDFRADRKQRHAQPAATPALGAVHE